MTRLEERCLYIMLKLGKPGIKEVITPYNMNKDKEAKAKHKRDFKKLFFKFKDKDNHLIPEELKPFLSQRILKDIECDDVRDKMFEKIYRDACYKVEQFMLNHLKGKINNGL